MESKKHMFAVSIAILLVLGGGYVLVGHSKQPASTENPIKIGGIFALTGLGASQGEQELKGATLALEEINKNGGVNGRAVELISEDVSLDKLNVAGSAAHKLIDVDNVVAIIGTTWDEPAQAILPIIEAAKVPMVGQNQTRTLEKDQPFNFFFSTWYNNEVGIRELLAYAKKKGLTKIAIIRPVAAGFYQYVSDTVIANANEYGIQIIANENLNNPATSDFRTPIAKLKIQKPDAVLVVVSAFTECALLKQMQELGVNIPVLATESAGDVAALSQCAGAMENIHFAYPRTTNAYVVFEKNYRARFNVEPETPSIMTAYDAVKIVANALANTNGEGGEKLQAELAKTKDFKGVSLPSITFDEKGYVITPADAFEIRTVKNGSFVRDTY
jgi:branched-chain amino acid transport system substrate-binding protein